MEKQMFAFMHVLLVWVT